MSYQKLLDIIENWQEMSVLRPFSNLKTNEIKEGAFEALAFNRPDLEIATFGHSELEFRNRASAKLGAQSISDAMLNIGHSPISWLSEARISITALKIQKPIEKKGTHSLYVILRDGYSQYNGRYGAYVGQTSKRPEDRFYEHVNGTRSGKGLPKHGIQLLKSLMWPWQNVSWEHRLAYESALNHALKMSQHFVVSGDVIPVSGWPDGFQKKLMKQILQNSAVT